MSAVVEVQVRDDDGNVAGNATGTIVGKDGFILTNRHVVRYFDYAADEYVFYGNIYFRRYDEEDFIPARLEKCSDKSDLALLKADEVFENYFTTENDADLHFGEKIHTIGNGNAFGLSYAQGSVAAPLRSVLYDGERIEAIQLSLTINEGNSGGPLINSRGQLVGITTFRLRNAQNDIIYGTSFALPLKTINEFFNEGS